jgi:hypothetical protein
LVSVKSRVAFFSPTAFAIRVIQKLQFLNNNRLKRQNAKYFARLVQQPTGLLNKSIACSYHFDIDKPFTPYAPG